MDEAPTIFLSRLIGLAALILGVAMCVGKPPLFAAIDLMTEDRGTLMLLGIGGVIAGLAVVLAHNVWTRGLLPLVVTLCGWWILIRGALVLILPAPLLVRITAAIDYPEHPYALAAVPLVVGGYLTVRGFLAGRRT